MKIYPLTINGHIIILADPTPSEAFCMGVLSAYSDKEIAYQWAMLHVYSIDGERVENLKERARKIGQLGIVGLECVQHIYEEVHRLFPFNLADLPAPYDVTYRFENGLEELSSYGRPGSSS